MKVLNRNFSPGEPGAIADEEISPSEQDQKALENEIAELANLPLPHKIEEKKVEPETPKEEVKEVVEEKKEEEKVIPPVEEKKVEEKKVEEKKEEKDPLLERLAALEKEKEEYDTKINLPKGEEEKKVLPKEEEKKEEKKVEPEITVTLADQVIPEKFLESTLTDVERVEFNTFMKGFAETILREAGKVAIQQTMEVINPKTGTSIIDTKVQAFTAGQNFWLRNPDLNKMKKDYPGVGSLIKNTANAIQGKNPNWGYDEIFAETENLLVHHLLLVNQLF